MRGEAGRGILEAVFVKRINAKEVLVVKERDTSILPCADVMIMLAGKDSEFPTSNQIRQGPEKMEEHSSDHPREDEQQQDAMEAKSDFSSNSGTFIYRHDVQDRHKIDKHFFEPQKGHY